MNDQQLLRYSRHILLPQIDCRGQSKLLDSSVVVVGAGGLGSPVAMYLAASGVGTLTIVDDDRVDLTNLQRQIIHQTASVGAPKAASAKQTLAGLNPETRVQALQARATGAMLLELVAGADLVVDASDNFATRHEVNRACLELNKPLVSGAAIGFQGQVTAFDFRNENSPCYACLFPEDAIEEQLRCSTMGVFAPLVGIIGSVQAAEALKLLIGFGTSLSGRLLLLDAEGMQWREIALDRDSQCPVCSRVAVAG